MQMQTAPILKDHSTARAIRDTQETESAVWVCMNNSSLSRDVCIKQCGLVSDYLLEEICIEEYSHCYVKDTIYGDNFVVHFGCTP